MTKEEAAAAAAKNAANALADELPEGVKKAQAAQDELLKNQQKQLKEAIANAPAGEKASAKGKVLQEQGAEAEQITHDTLKEIPGAKVNDDPVILGKGEGSQIDHAVSKGGKTAYIETKLTISNINQRTINQLTNATKAAKPGDSVFLQVARDPTPKERENLRKALGDKVFDKVKIVSKQTDLFNKVKSALQ